MRHFGVTFAEKKIIKAMDSDSMQSPHFQAPGASRLMDLGKTPIKTARLEHYLQFYPNRMDAHILLQEFTNGFKVNCRGPRQSFDCSNLISARQHEAESGEKKLKRKFRLGELLVHLKRNLFLIFGCHQ